MHSLLNISWLCHDLFFFFFVKNGILLALCCVIFVSYICIWVYKEKLSLTVQCLLGWNQKRSYEDICPKLAISYYCRDIWSYVVLNTLVLKSCPFVGALEDVVMIEYLYVIKLWDGHCAQGLFRWMTTSWLS